MPTDPQASCWWPGAHSTYHASMPSVTFVMPEPSASSAQIVYRPGSPLALNLRSAFGPKLGSAGAGGVSVDGSGSLSVGAGSPVVPGSPPAAELVVGSC